MRDKTKLREAVVEAARVVEDAWQYMEGGKLYKAYRVEQWLLERLGPAMQTQRDALAALDAAKEGERSRDGE